MNTFLKLWHCPGASFLFIKLRIHLSHVFKKQSKNASPTCINLMLYNEGKKVDIFNGDFAG